MHPILAGQGRIHHQYQYHQGAHIAIRCQVLLAHLQIAVAHQQVQQCPTTGAVETNAHSLVYKTFCIKPIRQLRLNDLVKERVSEVEEVVQITSMDLHL